MRKILFVTCSLFSAIAYAASYGPYVGVGAGAIISGYQTPKEFGNGSVGPTVAGQFYAGYNFNKYIGIELDSTLSDSTNFTKKYYQYSSSLVNSSYNSTLNYYGVGLSLVGYIPFSIKSLKLYSKLGSSWNNQVINISSIENYDSFAQKTYNSSSSSFGLLYAAGIEYDIINQYIVRIGYQNNGYSNIGGKYGSFTPGLVAASIGVKF